MTIANVNLRQVILKRGNTNITSAYTGPVGEIVIDTTANSIRVQDGVTAGGHLIATTTSSSNIASGAFYANVDQTTGQVNIQGNLIPSANAVYSIGSNTQQWKNIYTTSNVYIGNLALSNVGGQLAINGTVVSGTFSNSNVASYLPTSSIITGINANVTAANAVIATLANTNANVTAANAVILSHTNSLIAANAAITVANTALKTYVDNRFSTLTNGASDALDTLLEIGSALGNNVGFSSTIVTWLGNISANVTAANVNISTLQSNAGVQADAIAAANARIQTLDANVGSFYTYANTTFITTTGTYSNTNTAAYLTISTVISGINANVVGANTAMTTYVDAVTTAWTANASTQLSQITAANTNISALQANVGSFYTWANTNFGTSNYGNANVISYLSSYYTWANANVAGLSSQITGANTAMVTANTAMTTYVDAVTTAWTANAGSQANSLLGANSAIVTANTALKGYVDTQLSTLTNGASVALDTLLEIGSALGNNANFSGVMVTWLGNVTANITAANTNISTGATNISALQANLGATQIWANANIASINTNLGATQIWANANIASLTANLGSTQIWANANIASINTNLGATQIWANSNIASLTANLGSTQIWANANIASLNNSIIGANTAWQSNAAAQQVQINNIVTNANANAAAYLASGNDSTITSLQNSIVYIQGTLSGIPGQALATSDQLDAANAAIIGANVAWQANAAAQAGQITGANTAIVTANTALKTYVDTRLSTLTNGASAALDTLLEIGTALGNNANFSSVMVTWLGNVTANITGANVNVSALQSNTGALQNQITGANAAIVTANTAMKAYVDANTSSQSASINSLNSAQTTISGQIGTLQSNAVSQQSAIATLQSQVNGPVFMVTQTTGQSLSTVESFVSNLGLVFNSIEKQSPGGLYSTSTGIFTPNVSGFYQVSVECSISTANTNPTLSNVYYSTTLYKNSNAVSAGHTISPISLPGGSYVTPSSRTSCLVYLNGSTDYIRANLTYYVGSSGSNWNTTTGNTLIPNYFQAVWLRV